MAKIKLKDELFNPLYFLVKDLLTDNSIRYIDIYGGSSSSKTYSVVQAILTDATINNYSAMFFRKEQVTVRDTLINDIRTAKAQMGFDDIWNSYELEERRNKGDAVLRFRGLDRSAKIKGLSGYRKVIMDEADQFEEKDDAEMRRRLRGIEGQQIIRIWNPVSTIHYLKKELDGYEFVSYSLKWQDIETRKFYNTEVLITTDGSRVVVNTNYLDNHWVVGGNGYGFIDEHAIAHFNAMKVKNYKDYVVYALGKWGSVTPDDPFFYNWTIEGNVKPCKYIKGLPIYMTWDFGVVNTCLLFQVDMPNKKVWFFKEYHLRKMSTQDICIDIRKRYQPFSIFCTGDASGKIYALYKSIKMFLTAKEIGDKKIPNPVSIYSEKFFGSSNLAYQEAGAITNGILFNCEVINDPSLEITNADVLRMNKTSDGSLNKKEMTEKGYGHCGQAWYYGLCVYLFSYR